MDLCRDRRQRLGGGGTGGVVRQQRGGVQAGQEAGAGAVDSGSPPYRPR
ncbi:MAG: hypothetical protein WDN04_09200 [Rhodospirillales bacterium]